MRDISRTTTFSLRATLMAVVAVAALLPSVATVRAADDDDSGEDKFFNNVLEGIGLRERDRNLDYRERSPLVVPPNVSALPPPDASDAQARVPANWPVDQDVKRAKESKAAAKRPAYRRADSAAAEEGRALSPEQLTPGGSGRGTSSMSDVRSGDPYNRPTAESAMRQEKPSALGYMGNLFSGAFSKGEQDVAVFRGEPPRENLTEPPVGYQTPSPSQPYGLTGVAPLPKAQGRVDEAPR